MPQHALNHVLDRIKTTAFALDDADMSDGQLLDRYIACRNEAAFAALVRRHGPMVLAVCRRVVANAQDAEDAFQATFLVLVRKAATIQPRDLVGNWLYGVAYRAAMKVRTMTARQRRREKPMQDLPEPAAERSLLEDLLPLLDQELNALPEKYRLPIVLCDLEGKSRKEAAKYLGWPEGTVAGRIAQARSLLARRLARHGVPLSGGIVTALLAQSGAAAAVPAMLASATIKSAGLFAAGQCAAAASTRVADLVEQLLKAMLIGKLKFMLLVVAALTLIVVGGALFSLGQAADNEGPRIGLDLEQKGQRQQQAHAPERKKEPSKIDVDKNNRGPSPRNKELDIELRKLQGGWWWSSVEQFGSNPVFGFPFDYYYVFQGDHFVAYDRTSNVERHKGKIKVDPTDHTIDLIVADRQGEATWLAGRYGWKGNLLLLAFDPQPGMPRPKELKSAPGSRVQVWTCLPLELQGNWKVVAHVTSGKEASAQFLARDHQWTFAGYSVAMKDRDGVGRRGTFTFDPTAKLKTLELTLKPGLPPGPGVVPKDEFSPCIYKVEGDSLTICYPIPPNQGRPKDFSSTADSATGLVTLRRIVPEKAQGNKVVEALRAKLQTGNESDKRKAIEELGKLGKEARDAVPALARIVTEYPGGELDALAIVVLGKIGPAAKAALPTLHQRASSMFNGRREPVEDACVAIGKIGGWSPATTRGILQLGMGNPAYFAANPDATLPQLFDLLGDADDKVRIGALYAWSRLAEDRNDEVLKKHSKIRAQVVDYAVANLDARSPLLRQHAADLYRTLMPAEADNIIPVVIRLMNERAITWRDLDRMLSGRGEHAIVHDDLRRKALPSLIDAFVDASPPVHAELVIYLGTQMRHHVEWLPGALAHKNARVRAGAAATARLVAQNAKLAHTLREFLKDPDQPVRFHAAAALLVHDRNGAIAPVLECLIEGTRDGGPAMRLDAVRQLRSLGKEALPATAALLGALSDTNVHVRNQAAEVLLDLDARHTKRVLPLVQEALRNQTGQHNRIVDGFDLARRLGKEAAPLVPELIAIMEANTTWVGRAAEILEMVGPEGRKAIPVLQRRLANRENNHASTDMAHVCLALAKLGAADHARAARVLLPFVPRADESYLLKYYLPHYPNESVSELSKLLDESSLRQSVLATLGRLGDDREKRKEIDVGLDKKLSPKVKDELKAALLKLLNDKDLPVKISAMKTMRKWRFEPPLEQLVALVRACVSAEGNHTYALSLFMEGKEQTLVPVILEEAAKQDDYHRFYSVFSSAKPAAIPMLLRVVKTAPPRQCVHAAWGLVGLAYLTLTDESRAEAMATLLGRLPDLKSPVRGEVAMAILRIDTKSPPREAVVAVGEYLVDKGARMPGDAVYSLRQLGKNAAPATEHLRRALGACESLCSTRSSFVPRRHRLEARRGDPATRAKNPRRPGQGRVTASRGACRDGAATGRHARPGSACCAAAHTGTESITPRAVGHPCRKGRGRH